MAAGLGFKDFQTGEVLTAADVDGYLMQGIWVFASAAARNAAVTSPQEGNFAFTKDTNSLWYYDGAAWVASGATGDIEGVTAGVGISGGGTSGTVTVTNSMATEIAAKGDLIVGTGSQTFDNLTVGTNGHTLVADSSTATGLKWAAPAGGSGLTFISRTAFTNQSSQIFDNIFTSTYDNYVVVVEDFVGVGESTDDWQMQMRYGSTTETGNVYNGNSITSNRTGSTLTNTNMNDTNPYTIALVCGDSNQRSAITINFTNVGSASENARWYGIGHIGATNYGAVWFAGAAFANQTYTGFLFKSSSGNISGVVTVYGLAKS